MVADGVGKRFGETVVLQSIDLAIEPGEVIALLGPSGCGKTTLLRMIAGLSGPTSGRIAIGSDIVADAASGRQVPPEKRSIGMVFQDYALWPHMTVAGNVAFPLEMKRVPAAERKARVADALSLVGLEAYGERPPATLSGGQQQRVALARAIVSRPSVVLFDEPLSNLDRELREQLVVDIAALIRSLGLTGIYVTHDHAEAFAMADRVAVMANGRLIQVAPPEELVAAPANADVAAFLKLGLLLPSEKNGSSVVLETGGERLNAPHGFAGADGPGHLFVPRRALALTEPEAGLLHGTAVHAMFRGEDYTTRIRLSNGLDLDLAGPTRLADGARVGITFPFDAATWFPAPTRP
ncbi:hypothetical protein TM49_06745 [Martelella endophytica]|uniref:ABC transporter domain-containing protein n=1 Tax=Martelella endophytica TaxID=1486262 RepID=A0A0D5LMV5_MAREN|nr:hypothetical protein TM49_06745 [Martelella endophytica]